MRLILALCMLILTASAAGAGETEVYLKSWYFHWKETINGRVFIDEEGLLYGAGMAYTGSPAEGVFIRPSLEVWGGNPDYDGYRVEDWGPLKSKTIYLGTREEVTAAVKLPLPIPVLVMPFAGVGHKFWVRTLSAENWNTLYGKTGIRGELGRIFAEGGALVPFYTRIHVDWSLSGYSDFITEPKNKPSAFAEVGARLGKINVSVFYERLEFGKSDLVRVAKSKGASGVVLISSNAFQPDSTADNIGLKIGYSF